MLDERSRLMGFNYTNIDLSNMKNTEIKKLVFIGDGMSGKTQIILSIAKQIILYLHELFYASNPLIGEIMLHKANMLLEDKKLEVSSDFKQWADRNGFNVQYGSAKWDLTSISLDTETIGFEDFTFIFPYIWNNETYRIKLTGSDVGGQNIFDHMRNVIGKFAGINDVMIVVFDRSRALSCWNSVNQVKSVLSDKLDQEVTFGKTRNIPRIIYVGNKTDLEEHVRSQKWRAGILRFFMKIVRNCIDYGKGNYSIPSLVGEIQKEIILYYKIENNRITFPDLEVFLYNSIRNTDIHYKKIMTDINAKAIAREIAAQLVFNRLIEEYRQWYNEIDENEMVNIMNEFGQILFQRRPLAMQYSGGIELKELKKGSETDSFERVRSKWSKYYLALDKITDSQIESACMSAANAKSFLSEMGTFYNTNALEGLGVLEIIDDIIKEKLKLAEKSIGPTRKNTVIRRKIERF